MLLSTTKGGDSIDSVQKMLSVLKARKPTNYEIAQQTGKSQGYISDVKNGRIDPYNVSWITVEKIARYYKGEDNVKNFDEVVELEKQAYLDNYDANDSNEEVQDWLKDNAPALDFKVDNASQTVEVTNAKSLEDAKFVYDDDKWVVVDG